MVARFLYSVGGVEPLVHRDRAGHLLHSVLLSIAVDVDVESLFGDVVAARCVLIVVVPDNLSPVPMLEQREIYRLQIIDHGQVVKYEDDHPVETAKNAIRRVGSHSRYGFGELRVIPIEKTVKK